MADESNRLGAVIIEVSDLSRSVAFYRDLVGLDLHVGRDNDMPGDRWLDGQHGAYSWHHGAYLHFALYEAKGTPTTGAQLGFMVPDVDASHKQALAMGVRVEHAPRSEPWGGPPATGTRTVTT